MQPRVLLLRWRQQRQQQGQQAQQAQLPLPPQLPAAVRQLSAAPSRAQLAGRRSPASGGGNLQPARLRRQRRQVQRSKAMQPVRQPSLARRLRRCGHSGQRGLATLQRRLRAQHLQLMWRRQLQPTPGLGVNRGRSRTA